MMYSMFQDPNGIDTFTQSPREDNSEKKLYFLMIPDVEHSDMKQILSKENKLVVIFGR